jgi:thioredoxin-related protein
LLEFAPLEEVPLVDLAFSTDIDSAVKKARQQQRPLLLLFSGDSQQAQAFERTLRHPEVAKVLEDFELVRVDYRSNRRVAREYAVMSFPYIVVKNRHGFTEGHVLPSNNRDALRSTLISYTQQLF